MADFDAIWHSGVVWWEVGCFRYAEKLVKGQSHRGQETVKNSLRIGDFMLLIHISKTTLTIFYKGATKTTNGMKMVYNYFLHKKKPFKIGILGVFFFYFFVIIYVLKTVTKISQKVIDQF